MARIKASPRAPLDYARALPLQLWLGVVLLFLYLPLLVLFVFSFNDSRRTTVWRGFTLEWYGKLFENEGIRDAMLNSLLIAAACTVLSVILGALMAFMFWRFKFPFKSGLEGGMSLPIVVPEICMGVALLIFFAKINWPNDLPWPLNLTPIIIAHVTFSFPFVAIVVRARLESFNRELESAALDLGASQWQAFRDVIVPHMGPGLIAGALLAFTLSLDDLVVASFVSGPGATTLPMMVFASVRLGLSPQINALATLWIAAVALGLMLALRLGRPRN